MEDGEEGAPSNPSPPVRLTAGPSLNKKFRGKLETALRGCPKEIMQLDEDTILIPNNEKFVASAGALPKYFGPITISSFGHNMRTEGYSK